MLGAYWDSLSLLTLLSEARWECLLACSNFQIFMLTLSC